MSPRLLCAWLPGALVLCLAASTARAFQDPNRFAEPPEQAGGGGRYFTGSPADGFACTVCHSGYAASLRIEGLPPDSYVPAQSYRIVLNWPDELPLVALNAEITDTNGRAAGQLSVPPMDQLTQADLCEPVALQQPNAGVLPTEDGRQIGIAAACGARQATFNWIAPAADAGPVWLAGSLVASDEMGTVGGDGVVDFAHVVGSPMRPMPLAAELGGTRSGCSATARGTPGPRGGLWLFALAVVLLRVRRKA